MSQLEKNEQGQAVLHLTITKEALEGATQTVYLRTAKRYAVPGFRKGHAPRRLIEQYYGPGVFFEDALNEAFPAVYELAVAEHGITPVDRPSLDLNDPAENGDINLTVTVDIKPEVALGAYTGIKVPVREYTVTDSELETEISQIRERSARMVEQERPAQEKDFLTINYSGSIDGEPFEGGSAENATLELGSRTFIPGFEEQLVGVAAGEEKSIAVTFPEDYHAENLKGKQAVFSVKVINVKEKQLPELNDDFARDVSEFDTFSAFREDLAKKAQQRAEQRASSDFENALMEQISANAEVTVPNSMAQRQIDYHIRSFSYRLSQQGLSFEDFLKYTGQTIEQYREMSYNDAVAAVKRELVLEAVMKAEAIVPTQEELNASLQKRADAVKKTLEDFKAGLQQEDISYFTDSLSFEKTLDFLKANNEKTALAPETTEDEKPKAKAKTKPKTEKTPEQAPEETETAKKPAAKRKTAPKEKEET